MATRTKPSPVPGELLTTVEQTMARLHISRPTLYQLLNAGRIRSIKIGRARRIVVASLEQYINEAGS